MFLSLRPWPISSIMWRIWLHFPRFFCASPSLRGNISLWWWVLRGTNELVSDGRPPKWIAPGAAVAAGGWRAGTTHHLFLLEAKRINGKNLGSLYPLSLVRTPAASDVVRLPAPCKYACWADRVLGQALAEGCIFCRYEYIAIFADMLTRIW